MPEQVLSTHLNLPLMRHNQASKHVTYNEGMAALDQKFSNEMELDLAALGTPYTVPYDAAEGGDKTAVRYLSWKLTGALAGPAEVIFPTNKQLFLVRNQTDKTVTVKCAGQTGTAIAAGEAWICWVNGTDVEKVAVGPVPDLLREIATDVDKATPPTGKTALVYNDVTGKYEPQHVNTEIHWCGDAGGTGDAIALAPTPPVTSYYDGLTVSFRITAANTGAVTIQVSGLGAVDLREYSGASLTADTLKVGMVIEATYDNANGYFVMASAAGTSGTGPVFEAGTPADATNGGANDLTAVDFTGIPAGVRQITVALRGLDDGGTDNFLIQIGDSNGIETSGYVSGSARLGGAGNDRADSAAGMVLCRAYAGDAISGSVVLTRLDENRWVAGYAARCATTSVVGGGEKVLTGELDRLRITTAGGINTFTAGEINVTYDNPAVGASGGGGIVPLSTVEAAGGETSLEVALTGDYRRYKLVVTAAPDVADQLRLQFSNDGGTSWLTAGDYRFSFDRRSESGTAGAWSSRAGTAISLGDAAQEATIAKAQTLEIIIQEPLAPDRHTPLFVTGQYMTSGDYMQNIHGGGRWPTAEAVDAVRLFWDAGAAFLAGSSIALYGISEA